MSALSDLWRFTDYARRDAWSTLGEDPERIFIGAIDPASSWAWGKITGKDYTPVINQLGSPMGGGDLGLSKDGGVYDKADAAGYNTYPARNFYTVGDTVAGFFGGSAALGALGGGASSASSATPATTSAAANSSSVASPSVSSAFATPAMSSAPASGTSVGSAFGTTATQTGLNGTNYAKLAQDGAGLLGNGQQPQQQAPIGGAQPSAQQMKAKEENTQKLQIASKLQSLRMKPGKTQQEYQLMQQLQAALNGSAR